MKNLSKRKKIQKLTEELERDEEQKMQIKLENRFMINNLQVILDQNLLTQKAFCALVGITAVYLHGILKENYIPHKYLRMKMAKLIQRITEMKCRYENDLREVKAVIKGDKIDMEMRRKEAKKTRNSKRVATSILMNINR